MGCGDVIITTVSMHRCYEWPSQNLTVGGTGGLRTKGQKSPSGVQGEAPEAKSFSGTGCSTQSQKLPL